MARIGGGRLIASQSVPALHAAVTSSAAGGETMLNSLLETEVL